MTKELRANGQATDRGEKVNRLYEKLRTEMLWGRYTPGQRLIEADLTNDHAVSRGALRETFRQLAAEGLVNIVPNKGAIVRRLSRKEMADLFVIREALEALAASLAAANMVSDRNRKHFTSIINTIARLRKTKTPEKFSEENVLLHETIVEMAGNPQLAQLVTRLQLPLARLQVKRSVDQAYRDRSSDEHDKIIQAISDGDETRAAAAMRQHIRRAYKQILTLDESAF